MDAADGLCETIEQAVTDRLTAELGARGLLLSPGDEARARAQVAGDGERLLTSMIHRCYPLSAYDSQVLNLEFDSELDASRVRSTLAFGAATAGLLMPLLPDERSGSIELLSAIFNLGIGLLDSVCDENADVGLRVLGLIDLGDVVEAARQPRPRGWLRVQLSADLEADPSASFTVDVVETFFAVLHATYPGAPWSRLRGGLGDLLAAALDAERSSLVSSPADATRDQLTGFSHATSVLPFEIMGVLAQSGPAPVAARFLGEAMWRIDDLVDVCDDVRTGALNAVLLDISGTGRAALEGLLASDRIDRAAARAGDSLLRGVELAGAVGGARSPDVFLSFIGRYAGIVPPGSS